MQACQDIKNSLSQMSTRLEEIALSFEPAVNEPTELRLIAQSIDQFNRRPLEPLSFQLMHLEHLVDMLDNAETTVELWSAVTQTLSDYYVSQYYNNMSDEIIDNYLEIEPELHSMACRAHEIILANSTDDEAALEAGRTELMSRAQVIVDMLKLIKSREVKPEPTLFGLNNFIQLRDSVKAIQPNVVGDRGAEIWCVIDDFIGQFNKACYSSDALEPQIESEGTMESFAELYRIAAHVWPDEEVNTDLASDAYEYSVKKLDELVDYHARMKELYNATGCTYIKNM